MLHYNFPPYSVGEVGRFGAPGRREIGHGKLAWRALHAVLPTPRGLPLHDPRPLRHHRVQRLVARWRRCAAAASRMMDAGVPIERPVSRHRHGPDPRRQGLRGPQRHPRRRGSPRRHGLQGRRHRTRASPPCRWTSRSPASPRRSCASALDAGEGRPRAHPRRDDQGARLRPQRAFGPRAAHRDDPDRQVEDPRRHRHRRQGDPRDRRRDRRQGRHRRRGRDQDQLVRPRPDRGGDASGSWASSRSPKSARSTTARSSTSSISARS